MNRKSLLVTCASLPLLAACAADNGVGNVGNFIASTTADGTLEEVITAQGVKGFVGNSDGTVSEVRVRVDMSDPEAPAFYLSRDGGPEENFYLPSEPVRVASLVSEATLASSYFLVNNDGDSLELWLDEGDSVFLSLDRGISGGSGTFGLQTAPENLPTETAYYSGGWNIYGDNGVSGIEGGGYMSLTADFDNGNLIGMTEGGFYAWNDDLEAGTDGGFEGVIVGEIDGSEMTGTMTLIGGASGELDMQGAFYGETASELSGGIGGTLSTSIGDVSGGGAFVTSGGFFEGPCFECD